MKDKRYFKILFFIFIFIFILLFCCKAGKNSVNKDAIYQYSTINALLEGVFDGDITLGSLKNYGDFGIGTFNTLDGEMIFLDGYFTALSPTGKFTEWMKTGKLLLAL